MLLSSGTAAQPAPASTGGAVLDVRAGGVGTGTGLDFVPYVPSYEEKNPTAVSNRSAVAGLPPRADELLSWFQCMDEDLGVECENQAIQPERVASEPAARVRENRKSLPPQEQQRRTLQAAVDAYRAKTSRTEVDGAEFRRFVEGSAEQKAALAVLTKHGEILMGIRVFGTPEEEYQKFKRESLTRIAPTGMGVDELGRAIDLGMTAWRTAPGKRVAAADRFDLYLGLHPVGLLAPTEAPAQP
jgi:hypothetical protein